MSVATPLSTSGRFILVRRGLPEVVTMLKAIMPPRTGPGITSTG